MTTGARRQWLLDVPAGALLALALAAVYLYDGRMATPLPDEAARRGSLLDGELRPMPPAASPLAVLPPDPASEPPAADALSRASQSSPPHVPEPPLPTNKESDEKPAEVVLGDFVISGMPEPPKPVVTEKVVEALLTAPRLNKFGNPEGKDVGLASANEFAGARILMWSTEPQVHELIFTRDNPLWAALREKGFQVRLERRRFEPNWLKDVDQVWIFAGQASGIDAKAEKAIVAFVMDGNGMYLAADNEPFLVEATRLTSRLFHAQISGDFQGENLIAVRGHGVTREEYLKSSSSKRADARSKQHGARLDVINRATHYAEEHPLLMDVNFIYEGFTISHIDPSPALQTVLRASDGQILAAVATDRCRRVVVDCGFTRYAYSGWRRYVTETAGTLLYAENIAAYLMGKDDKRSDWTTWQERRELMVKYRRSSQQEILALLKDADPHKRWAAAAAAAGRSLDIPEALIELLRDDDEEVRQQAHLALRQLAEGSDYGPSANASAKNREIAYQNWRRWLSRIQVAAKYDTLNESEILAPMTSPEAVQRWAAANSARRRRLNVPDALIRCLTDQVPEVREEAHRALAQISGGVDFGPAPGAAESARAAAVVEWKRWRLPRKFPAMAQLPESEVIVAMRSQDDDLRWAAVLAVRHRRLQPTTALVELLADRESSIRQEARQALAQLSKHDYGPSQGATPSEIAAAQRQWAAWWKDKDEQKATRDLRIAKLLLERDPAEARRRLEQIIAAHPNTEAAAEAKQLLNQNP
jgi:HEAT repeat protein